MGFFSNDYELSIGKNRISVKKIKDGICVTKIADEQFSSDTLLIARIRPFEAIVMHALKEARGESKWRLANVTISASDGEFAELEILFLENFLKEAGASRLTITS